MSQYFEQLKYTYDSIKDQLPFVPKVALVLGSGLGALAEHFQVERVIDYKSIPGFPVSTVEGHAGRFLFGKIKQTPVVAMQGRVHYYEGYDMKQVVLPIRLMRMMGAEVLILTNAAGGINSSFAPGDLMVLTDHITSFVPSPLIGENLNELGTRFPDMTEVYSKRLRNRLLECGDRQKLSLQQGVYLQTTGPNYETPAEIQMYKMLGADAVGMSTACEAMAARHCGFEVCGISCITNMACGISSKPLSHEEVQETAGKISQSFTDLLLDFIPGCTEG
jgi:purine-nucleoside phosphorylase